jgi:hypothetical protein
LKSTSDIERKLQEQLLLARHVDKDRLMLADSVLNAALDGSRPLTINERAALEASPLTLRRFRQLVIDRKANLPQAAANDASWFGSPGMLRAASGTAAIEQLVTDDGYWTLDFLQQGQGWQVIIKLMPAAPFAAILLHDKTTLRVVDGAGSVILQGQLDGDGEHEAAWPFAADPAQHFQQHGASFFVMPVGS